MNDNYAGWDGPSEEAEAPEVDAVVDEEPEAPEEPETEAEGAEGAEDAPADPVEPEAPIYAGKYKTVEDLERSYQELERKLGERERLDRERPAPTETDEPDVYSDPEAFILSKSIEELSTGEYDGIIGELVGRDVSTWGGYDYLRFMNKLETNVEQTRAKRVQLQTLDQQVTTAFSAEYPAVMNNPALTAAAKAVTAELWSEIQQGVRPFEGPEQFARMIGETLKAQLAGVGPVAMGAYNAQRQAQKPRQGVPPGGVTPSNPARPSYDPNKYRGWNGPRD